MGRHKWGGKGEHSERQVKESRAFLVHKTGAMWVRVEILRKGRKIQVIQQDKRQRKGGG